MRVLMIGLLLALVSLPVRAQQDLPVGMSVEGTVSGEEEVWTFNAVQNSVYSFLVDAVGDFDPVLTLRDADGDVLLVNDDYAYPDRRDALLEAITIPVTGRYEIAVSGYDGITGDYELTVLPGYAIPALRDEFDTWESLGVVESETTDDSLVLAAEGVQSGGAALHGETLDSVLYFVQSDVDILDSRNGWRVGLALHGAEARYVFEVNQRGEWRFIAIENERERVIRDWSGHPGIIPGEMAFTLGVLANDSAFDLFYSDQLLGSVTDDALDASGAVGVSLVTADAIDSRAEVAFSDFLVTVPVEVAGSPIFPTQLVQGAAPLVVRELERRQLIPVGGRQVLNVTESFFESRSPGVDVLPLGRGTTFERYALSTTVTLEQLTGQGVTGCGLTLRQTDENAYTVAYLDNVGGYGLSQRMEDTFEGGIYGENTAWDATESHRLLVVVREERLHYYIDGTYVGSLELEAIAGQVGNVVVNFDPVEALCRFENTWLWTWD